MPSWLASTIKSSQPGTEVGYSYPLDNTPEFQGNGTADKHRLVLTKSFGESSTSRPAEYGISIPASVQNLSVIEMHESVAKVTPVAANIHLLPKRDQQYAAILKDRLLNAGAQNQHRTLLNQENYQESRGSVKLFQRPSEADHAVDMLVGSPDSGTSSVRGSKRLRNLDELPQHETKLAATGKKPRVVDDIVMEILVNKDSGWPLMQLSKAVKDAGGTVTTAQLKAKLLDICVYQRRGEDHHPKYYLKSEYK